MFRLSLVLLPTLLHAAPPTIAEIDGLCAARVTDLSRFDAALDAKDPALVRATVYALGRLQSQAALPRLRTALTHGDPKIRAAAAFGWGQLASAPAGPLVGRLKTDPSVRVRLRAAEALGKLAVTDRAALIHAADADLDHSVRRAARIALGLVARRREGAAPQVAEHLPRWLAEPHAGLRYGAAFLLRRAEALVSLPIFEATTRCATDPSGPVRALCVRALGRFTPKVLPKGLRPGLDAALLAAARDPDWRVNVEAWRAAGAAGGDLPIAALGAIPQQIRDQREQLATPRLHAWTAALDAVLAASKQQAALAMPAVGQLSAMPVPEDDPPSVALGRAHVRCRVAAIRDRFGGARLAACHPNAPAGLIAGLVPSLLAHLPPPDRATAVAARYPAAKTAVMRIALLEVAGELPQRAEILPIIEAGALDPDVAVFSQAAASAAKVGSKDLAPTLRARFEALHRAHEHEAVIALIDALGTLKDAAAKPLLRRTLSDPNVAVAQAAAKALSALGEPSTAAPAPRVPKAVERPTARTAVIETTKGTFTIALHGDDAPLTVKNFVDLAQRKYYDGLVFHRVVGDFVVQGGDPRGDGWGGPGYAIPCEINVQPYTRGAVGMALAGKDTGGSQWFVTHSPQPHLDGRYTVFGHASALDVVDALAVGDRIVTVTIR